MNNMEDLLVLQTQVRCTQQRMDNQEEEEMEVTQRVEVLPLFVLLLPVEIRLSR